MSVRASLRPPSMFPCLPCLLTTTKMLADHIMSHLQPWVLDDIQALLSEPELSAVRARKYVGIHVRRGDKLQTPQGSRIESEARRTGLTIEVNLG